MVLSWHCFTGHVIEVGMISQSAHYYGSLPWSVTVDLPNTSC